MKLIIKGKYIIVNNNWDVFEQVSKHPDENLFIVEKDNKQMIGYRIKGEVYWRRVLQ